MICSILARGASLDLAPKQILSIRQVGDGQINHTTDPLPITYLPVGRPINEY